MEMLPEKNLAMRRKHDITDHDTECAMKAGQLIDLGFMGEEFACYGAAYVEEQRINYFVCEKEQTMLHFLQKKCLQGILPTSTIYEVKRFQVPVGRNDFFQDEIRKATVQRLKALYGRAFFRAAAMCQRVENQDLAWPMLRQASLELRNSFDMQIVQIVEGLAADAYQMKQLCGEHYTVIKNWADRERQLIDDGEQDGGNYRRCYYGFCSNGGNGLSCYANASLYTTERRRRDEIARGKQVSPIIYKVYTTDVYLNLTGYKKDFLALLRRYFTPACMESLQEIWNLPSSMKPDTYQQCLEMVWTENKAAAIQDFLYYGNLWNLNC